MLKGIIFDLDGVITDTAEYHYLAWKKTAEAIGVPFDREFNEELKGVSRMDSLYKILDHGGIREQFSEVQVEELAYDKNKYYQELIKEITPNDLLPGIEAFLTECKEAGLKIGLASASKNGPVILDRLEVTSFFDTIVDPGTLKKGKPNPEIFVKAAEQLQLQVNECVGVEDAEAGIQAIKGANMFAVGVGTPERMKLADWQVGSTAEITLARLKEKLAE
ncbi:beta-phosphoglucomutase [Niallia sp. MER TA 168]|uniref:beta-phosphoglucomutase n=1 Tax=Niallia sp. MER TA 168 TaxID=2939568 RepID=UPI00203D08BD|nr:beta-phosphoglucomutase [Niallia sp. MER TA 168]MCM3363355.1 beta-phosphoglucomutase [Niallia sp. MER TA 168]